MNGTFLQQLKEAHAQGMFAAFIRNTAHSGTLFEAIPELRGLDRVVQNPRWHPEGDVWTHTLLVIDNLPADATFTMCLAALLHDIGKAATTVILETGVITSHGHEEASEQMALPILDALGADEELKQNVAFLVRHHMMAHSKDTTAKALRRLIRKGGHELVDQLLQHGVADVAGGCREFAECERLRQVFDQMEDVEPRKINPVLTGEEIMEITGFPQGPEIGRIMRYLASLGDISKEEAINILKQGF